MPKTDIEAIPHNKSNETREQNPAFADVFPYPHPKGTCQLERAPTTPKAAIFRVHHDSPPSISLRPITP